MKAEYFFGALAIASFAGLVLLLACDWSRKPKPTIRPTVPANRLPPRIEP